MSEKDFTPAQLERLRHAFARYRQAKGLTWKQLAQRLGVKPPSISRFVSGGGGIKLKTAMRFARLVNDDVYQIAGAESIQPGERLALRAPTTMATADLVERALQRPADQLQATLMRLPRLMAEVATHPGEWEGRHLLALLEHEGCGQRRRPTYAVQGGCRRRNEGCRRSGGDRGGISSRCRLLPRTPHQDNEPNPHKFPHRPRLFVSTACASREKYSGNSL